MTKLVIFFPIDLLSERVEPHYRHLQLSFFFIRLQVTNKKKNSVKKFLQICEHLVVLIIHTGSSTYYHLP